jgi:hypothetical protein
VARLEHRAILEHLAEIEALEPGLVAQERKLIAQISAFWQIARRLRDAAIERTLALTYGAATYASDRQQQRR